MISIVRVNPRLWFLMNPSYTGTYFSLIRDEGNTSQ